MLYCNNCGQCLYISNDNFILIRNTSGWETVYIDPDSGEDVDYGDRETTDNNDDHTECPHCASSDIDWEWGGTKEEAEEAREEYEARERRRAIVAEREKIKDAEKEKMRKTGWDI